MSTGSRWDAAARKSARCDGQAINTALARRLLPFLVSQYLHALQLRRVGAGRRHSVPKPGTAPQFLGAVHRLRYPTISWRRREWICMPLQTSCFDIWLALSLHVLCRLAPRRRA